MNSLASAPGWRDVAIWVMPSAVYALASDTLIGVVRAWVIARARHSGQALADDEPTPMALIGASVLWLIRLAIAPVSTITGFRRWLLDECPVAPGRKAAPAGVTARTRPAISTKQSGRSAPAPRRATKPGKQAQLLALAGQRHDLAVIPLTSVSRIATSIAAEIDLAPGTARRVLLAHVRALRNGQNTGARSQPWHGRNVMRIVVLIAAAGVLLTGVKWAFFPFLPGRRLPRHRVRYLRIRLRLRLHPGPGHASIGELWLRWGRLAVFRRSGRARRSLSLRQRLLGPVCAYSILIGRAHYRHALRMPLDEHAVVTSPPQGRQDRMAGHGHPALPRAGAVHHDQARRVPLTSGIRARRGPVHVFNPQAIGDVPSTFRWNPVDGCADPATAIRRADAFAQSVSQHGVEEGTFWASKASDYLRAYFHAAALAGLDLRAVARWVTGMNSTDAETILASTGTDTGWHWASQLAELRGQANRTAQTIRMTMSRALAFLADPALAASVTPAPGQSLDLEDFLRQSGTLYLIAETRGEDSPVAPLFACLASEIHYTAALAGSRMPGARLDPPLLTRPGRGHTDLPGTGPVLARGLRRQGHPDHHRRPRRGPAPRPVGRRRRPRHRRHLRRQDLAPRHQRPRRAGDRVPAVRHGGHARARPGLDGPLPRHDPGHDPPAPRHPCARHPRRLLPRHRQAPHGLERPPVPPRPPRSARQPPR